MMNGTLQGVLLVGYDARDYTGRDNTPRIAYSVNVVLGSEVVGLALDDAPNGNTLPTGTLVDIDVEFTARRSVGQADGGRSYVGRASLSGKAVAVRKSKAPAAPAAAAA